MSFSTQVLKKLLPVSSKLISYSSTNWNSATFSGARHIFVIDYKDFELIDLGGKIGNDLIVESLVEKTTGGFYKISILTLNGYYQ